MPCRQKHLKVSRPERSPSGLEAASTLAAKATSTEAVSPCDAAFFMVMLHCGRRMCIAARSQGRAPAASTARRYVKNAILQLRRHQASRRERSSLLPNPCLGLRSILVPAAFGAAAVWIVQKLPRSRCEARHAGGRAVSAQERGSSSVNTAPPPSRSSYHSSPPMVRARCLASARPRPVDVSPPVG